MTKNDLRKHIRMLKSMYTPEQLHEQSEAVIARLQSNPAFANAKIVMMYYSLDDEVCTKSLIDTLVKRGKTVLLPVVTSNEEMELHRYTNANDLQGGFFNIMEPVGEQFTDYDDIDVAVVPGMSFDTRGNRLGRGKGYYDRFLKRHPQIYKIGVCFDFQKMPGIPTEDNDVRMDIVV
ncbi:MAG: 5-formyltetrahydrofolate cyclo-ligase [Prevotella sp.]|nr:5-formyltetrahydrofolate cyclo-ligase [Prevotella sp.]